MLFRLLSFCLAGSICLFSSSANAQMISGEQPVIYSKTVIALVPGYAIPKTISQSPELQGELKAETVTPESTPETQEGASTEADKPAKQTPLRHTINVQVRPNQIRLDSGMINNYALDDNNAVLTYFTVAEPRSLLAENIQKPLDILFIRDDGTIVQIVPEVIPAYLPDDIGTDFPLRALLYLKAGLAEAWGIEPGYRIEHGMFNPKPIIYVAPGSESKATVQ